uniref:aconitase family protein n=1 Tax=uncultured Thalassolituus sp. TaxID=285273 RepID=UPI002609B173
IVALEPFETDQLEPARSQGKLDITAQFVFGAVLVHPDIAKPHRALRPRGGFRFAADVEVFAVTEIEVTDDIPAEIVGESGRQARVVELARQLAVLAFDQCAVAIGDAYRPVRTEAIVLVRQRDRVIERPAAADDRDLAPEKLGFGIVAFACTTCNGMSGALDPVIQQEIIDRDLYATAVLSGNRNFDGRIHPYAKQAFLASPPLVVAYAIAGTVRFDIEKDVLAVVDGKEIRLMDIWPSDEEIDAIVGEFVKPQQFRDVYIPMFDLGEAEKAPSPLYDWREMSTYIRRPPYWEGALAGERTLKGMRPLALLPDNITTDHLSPSNAILMNSAAGEYLHKMGLPEEDFNSYATHRGDHLTAQRATFANPKLMNEMVRDEDGNVKQGSLARIEPEGQVTRMWEAIETYMNRKQPLIIVAGADYGQGSSRDWAAKGVRLAGVEVIVAEGFERIHRTNLIGMGVLPVQFKEGTTRKTLELDGTETYDVVGERTPRGDLTLIINRQNGETVEVPVTCRLDTAEEVVTYNAGGVLQKFAKDFLKSN